ncbi:hypothetical protein [Nocardia brasiliensis]|uniref:hypothetical protein n=1 Tax=Nocardia brasiliensis TaxID=37326 RepID=UPI0033EEA989
MSAEIVSLVVAFTGVIGALGGTLVTQRASYRVRQLETEHRRRERSDEISAADRRAAQDEKRSTCVELNIAAREFRAASHDCVIQWRTGREIDSARLDSVRIHYREVAGKAQMLLSDRSLSVADEVNHSLHLAYTATYGELRQLLDTPESFNRFHTWMDGSLVESLRFLRRTLREELGVVAALEEIDTTCRRFASEREQAYDRAAYIAMLNRPTSDPNGP